MNKFIIKAIWVNLLVFMSLALFFGRFTFAFAVPEATCLPFHFVLIDRKDHLIARGEYVQFFSDKRIQGLPQGKQIMKLVAGRSDDHVIIHNGEVKINNRLIKNLNPQLVASLDQKMSDFDADYILADGELFGIGTSPESYDSAYWGPIRANQRVNEVHPIF